MIHPKLHVDIQWMNRISVNLARFRKVKTDTYNCRCPVCGDSQKSTKLARFYFYVKKMSLKVWCHKCGYSNNFFGFMKDQYPTYFEDYKKETLFDSFSRSSNLFVPEEIKETTQQKKISINTLKKISVNINDLEDDHPAKAYLLERSFSKDEMSRLYYTDDFKTLASLFNLESGSKLKEKEPRIIIPFINNKGTIEIIQGRSLDKNSNLKYITIKTNEDAEKVFGLYDADHTKTVYCVEGPLDSLFVDNCLASCDANLTRVDADVYIWDVQSRNKDVCKYMEAAIEAGKSVVIWPFSGNKKLDINDMIKSGMTKDQIMNIIKKNTFSGLTAKMKFLQWKKV